MDTRAILALMDHPGMARVLDAGETPEGRPYFVMQRVAGLTLTAYCDKHELNIRQRLELLITCPMAEPSLISMPAPMGSRERRQNTYSPFVMDPAGGDLLIFLTPCCLLPQGLEHRL
jgi:hypothetical protein